MLIKEISKTAEEFGLTMLILGASLKFYSHSQPLSIEELYDLAQQLTEQQKEDEDECGTKEMQTKDLTDILSATDTAGGNYVILTLTGNGALQ